MFSTYRSSGFFKPIFSQPSCLDTVQALSGRSTGKLKGLVPVLDKGGIYILSRENKVKIDDI